MADATLTKQLPRSVAVRRKPSGDAATHRAAGAAPLRIAEFARMGKLFRERCKQKFSSPGAAGALQEVIEAPGDETNWEALILQIRKALEEDGSTKRRIFDF